MAKETPKFEPGDVVRLISGSPDMIIVHEIFGTMLSAYCVVWINHQGGLETANVPAVALTKPPVSH